MEYMTIEEALKRASSCLRAKGIESPRLEAELLLSFLTGYNRIQLITKHEEVLTSYSQNDYFLALDRRCSGEPLAYIVGEKYFFGLRFKVNNEVLIPRPETELIIERILELSGPDRYLGTLPYNVLELGTGSGNIAVTIALLKPDDCIVWATDISEKAISVAKTNAVLHGVREKIIWRCGDYYNALGEDEVDYHFNIVIANPPYLSDADMLELHSGVKNFEPIQALYGGEDGLDGYRSIISGLEKYVKLPSVLIMEAGFRQKEYIEKLCYESGMFCKLRWHKDLAGHNRILEGLIKAFPC